MDFMWSNIFAFFFNFKYDFIREYFSLKINNLKILFYRTITKLYLKNEKTKILSSLSFFKVIFC